MHTPLPTNTPVIPGFAIQIFFVVAVPFYDGPFATAFYYSTKFPPCIFYLHHFMRSHFGFMVCSVHLGGVLCR